MLEVKEGGKNFFYNKVSDNLKTDTMTLIKNVSYVYKIDGYDWYIELVNDGETTIMNQSLENPHIYSIKKIYRINGKYYEKPIKGQILNGCGMFSCKTSKTVEVIITKTKKL